MRRLGIGIGLLLGLSCGGDGGGGSGGGGAAVDPFDPTVLADYHLTMATADWDAIVADPHDNTWRRGTLAWRGETYADIAVRPSGERSRIPGNPKPSLRFEFDEFVPDREFHGISTLKLDAVVHDPSMMRARLQYPAYAAAGIPAPRYVHARLFVNGVLKGLYGVEERLGKEFLHAHFGRPHGQMWTFNEVTDDLEWQGDDLWRYVPNQWRTEFAGDPAGAEDIRRLHDLLHHDPAQLGTLLDVDAVIRFLAVEVLTGEGDGYLSGPEGNDAENMILYRPPSTGLFLFIPWDRDQGFYRRETEPTFAFDRQHVTRRLILENPAHLDRYKQALRQLLADFWSTDKVLARMDAVFEQIHAAAMEDPLKPYANEEVLEWRDRLKQYVIDRNAAFQAQLQ